MNRYAKPATFALGVALAAVVWWLSPLGNVQEDLFIYRAGAALPMRGKSPYDTEALRAEVATQYPGSPHLINNCGFFLTPQAVALFRPFALLPWDVSRVTWLALSFGVLLAGLWMLPNCRWWLAVVVLADLLLAMVTSLGQTTTLMAGLLLVGYGLARRGWLVAAGLAWSGLFIKPHLALPLLPLAFLHGRRTGFTLVAAVVVSNLVGLAMSPDSLSLPAEYLRHVRDGHKLVSYNRIEFNPQLTSWNNALLAVGGPLIELGVGGMLAGYAFVAAVVAARCRGRKPDSAWLLAVAAAGGPVCCQVWAYELLMLVGLLPWATNGTLSRRQLVLLAALWLLKSVPVEAGNAVAEAVSGRLGQTVLAYRGFAALGILGVVLTALPPGGGFGRPRR